MKPTLLPTASQRSGIMVRTNALTMTSSPATVADAAAMPNAPLRDLVDRYHELYDEGILVADSDGNPTAATGLDINQNEVRGAVAPIHFAYIDCKMV